MSYLPFGNVALGKLPAERDPRTLRFSAYATSELPTPPPTLSQDEGISPSSWPLLANDRVGNCTVVTAAHLTRLWRHRTRPPARSPAERVVVDAYKALGGYDPERPESDGGVVVQRVLRAWRRDGLYGSKILAYVAIDPKDPLELRRAIHLFGGVYAGFDLPATAQAQTRKWSIATLGAIGPGAPGTWGGHAVPLVGYGTEGVSLVTWARRMTATWGFVQTYADEAYAVLSPDWLNEDRRSPAGFDLAALRRDLAALGAP